MSNMELSKEELAPRTLENRAYGLDALRGLAILTMVLSGMGPMGVLPNWMYHAQTPPPNHIFEPIPGLTWVDLVFPFFLFSMGVAIPLMLSRRIKQGYPYWKIIIGILHRGFLLGFFAIYIQHIRPWVIKPEPDNFSRLLFILGFILLFFILMRFPNKWDFKIRWGLRISGWLGVILLLSSLNYPDGSGFQLSRSDIIIILLTAGAVFGSLFWLITQNNILFRLGILGLILAFRLSAPLGGWIEQFWNYSPIPWIFQWPHLVYLFIVIPGTIIGDLILKWMNQNKEPVKTISWSVTQYHLIAILMILFNLVLLTGLQGRWLWETILIVLVLSIIGWGMIYRPNNETERLYKTLYLWGVYWLILGLLLEPYEGGIKKDPNTMSYFFITSGLAIFTLIALSIYIDIFRKKRWFQLLIDNGQNPIIAYTAGANFVFPILYFTGLLPLLDKIEYFFKQLIAPSPWIGFIRAVLMTIIIAIVVSQFTKRKIFWRT